MERIEGQSPDGSPRVVEVDRRADKLTIWIHAPSSEGGWEITVSAEQFLAGLARAFINGDDGHKSN
jgi:hypothetical protein